MCERVSVVASTKGKIQYYAAPGLNSHGNARAGWDVKGGAEVEWTGESPEYLTVRHETDARLVKELILNKYKTRSEFCKAEIFETRGEGGQVMWYPRNQAELCDILAEHSLPSIGLCNYEGDCIDLVECQNLDARDYRGEITNLIVIKGYAFLYGFAGNLPSLATIGGCADLRKSSASLPALATIEGWAELYGFTGTINKNVKIEGNIYR